MASSVHSVLAQSVSDLELIVVDDGSTDDTLALARAIPDPRVRVHTRPNGGLPAARNTGISAARAPIVSFLDSDDLLLPRYLETVRNTFAADPEVAFVYCNAWTFNDATRRVRRRTTAVNPPAAAPSTAAETFRELLQRNFIIIPVSVRREAIVAAGMFDETMTSAEDWDMWLRLSAAGYRSAQAPEPLGLRREHAKQMSADGLRMIGNHVYLLAKLLREQSLSDADAALVSQRLDRARRDYRVLTGDDRLGALALHLRRQLSALRQRLGLGARWYREPPPSVTAAFGDLARLD